MAHVVAPEVGRRREAPDPTEELVRRQIDMICHGGLEGEAGKPYLAAISYTEPKAMPLMVERLKTSSGDAQENMADVLARSISAGGQGSDSALLTLADWLGRDGLVEKASATFRLLATRHRPEDAEPVVSRLRETARQERDGFRSYNAKRILRLFDGGLEAELRLLDCPEEEKVVDGVRALNQRFDAATISRDDDGVQAVLVHALPKLLAIIREKGPSSEAGIYAIGALWSWSRSESGGVIDGVLNAASPKTRLGMVDPRLGPQAIAVLAHVLPEAGENVLPKLLGRIERNGLPDALTINALNILGDEAKDAALGRAKTMKDENEVRGVGLLLALKGKEGVEDAFRFCDTSDPAQMVNGLVLLSCLRLAKDGEIRIDESAAKSVAEALDDRRLEDAVRRAVYRGLLKEDGQPSDKVTGALIHIGSAAVKPLLDRAWDVTDAAELWTITNALANMGMRSLNSVLEFADHDDADRRTKGMMMLAAYALLGDEWEFSRRRGQWGQVDAVLSGERVKGLVERAEQEGPQLASDMAKVVRSRIQYN
jgi:hypothetical protein